LKRFLPVRRNFFFNTIFFFRFLVSFFIFLFSLRGASLDEGCTHFFFSLMKRKSSQKEKSRLRLRELKLPSSG